MPWLRFTPETLASFISIVLLSLAVVYLLSLRNKSKSTIALIIYLVCFWCYLLVGNLQIAGPAEWQLTLLRLKIVALLSLFTSQNYFALTFLGSRDDRKLPVLFWITAFISLVLISISASGQLSFDLALVRAWYPIVLVLHTLVISIAPVWVFLSRSVLSSRTEMSQRLGAEEATKQIRGWLTTLIFPQGEHAVCLRNFGLLMILPLIIFIIIILVHRGWLPLMVRELSSTLLGCIYVFGIVTLHLSYVREHASVNHKLVGLSLITALLVCQVVVSTLNSPAQLVSSAGIRPMTDKIINFTAKPDGGYFISAATTNTENEAEHPATTEIDLQKQNQFELGFEFPFYQHQHHSVFISEDGILTFNTEPANQDRQFQWRRIYAVADKNDHLPRIMPLNTDFVLDDQSSLTHTKDQNSILFAWHDVVQRLGSGRSSFGIELKRNGDIKFIYKDVDALMTQGQIGIANGSQAPAVDLNLFNLSNMEVPGSFSIVENITSRYRNHAHQKILVVMMVVIGTVLLVILVFPILFQRALIQPLNQLLEGLQRVDQGNLGTTLSIGSRDELGRVALYFNRMTKSLADSHHALTHNAEHLEKEVIKRTQKLDEQNLKLEQQWLQLKELDEAKSRMFANLSHEFRTPLTLTLGPLEDLRSGFYGIQPLEVKQQLEIAIRNSRRVLRLINQMLDLGKIEADRLSLRIQNLDLCRFLRDMGLAFEPLAERQQIQFGVRIPSEPVVIECDPAQLEKVFTNLLSNAFKFTHEGGVIRMSLKIDDLDSGEVKIKVKDNGVGIPKAELEHVFQRFHQVHEAEVTSQPGTGIGLSLARELTELHSGQILLESEEGFGSTFTVALPTVSPQAAYEHELLNRPRTIQDTEIDHILHTTRIHVEDLTSESRYLESIKEDEACGEEKDAGQTTVLIVDDNAGVRAYLRKHLEQSFHTIEAEDGLMALQRIQELIPDLIISDVMMPNMDGTQLCARIKQDPELDYIPVVLLTAKAERHDKLSGLSLGADDYLEKPFDIEELMLKVNSMIDSRRRLIAHFTRPIELSPSHIEVPSSDQKFLMRIQEIIEEQLNDPDFSVEQLANLAGQSRGNLHKKLTNMLGEHPSNLIRGMRLQRAADLLEQRAGSVSEIAYSVGFKGVAHFSRSFRAKYGSSPTQYITANVVNP